MGDEAWPLDEKELPLELPHVDKYGPGPMGEGPLANLTNWVTTKDGRRETSTMPGYAGSSWYFLRYMDPHNDTTFCDRKVSDYWNQVDVYVGGTEHAVGHLLYSRMWTKVLFDLGLIGYDEPYKRLVNQGMITGRSAMAKIVWEAADNSTSAIPWVVPNDFPELFGPASVIEDRLPVDSITIGSSGEFLLTMEDCKKISDKYPKFKGIRIATFEDAKRMNQVAEKDIKEEWFKKVVPLRAVDEKMSKSKLNTFNPDDLVDKFGADTFRMYEMFLGPVEASKPWDTKGIEGVHRFLKKLWRLFYDEMKGKVWKEEKATPEELKILHRTIKKVEEDTERFSFNTAVSTFMICVNELNDIKCHKKEVLEQVLILLTPYAPHIAEELWHLLGNAGSVLDAGYPVFDVKHVTESSKEYPVSVNGKVRTNINIAMDAQQPEVEQIVLANETVQKWLEGKSPKKIIYVKNKMVNVVV